MLNPSPPRLDADLASKQLVLYRVPSSISVPEEQDSVRKAIIEARARLREKKSVVQAEAGLPEVDMDSPVVPPAPVPSPLEEDPDAMELD